MTGAQLTARTFYSPSSKHCKMLPAYDKQSGILLAHVEEVDEDMLPMAAPAPDADAPVVDLVVSASGMTPRQSGMHAFITLRLLQQGLWSRPPAAQRASIAANNQ